MVMSFHSKKVVTARTPKRCQETGLPIRPGDKYVRMAGVWEGDFYSCTMLPEVAEVADRTLARVWQRDGEGLQIGGLVEYLHESVNGGHKDCADDAADARVLIAVAKARTPEGQPLPRWVAALEESLHEL
jgi:hypothetical protein